VTAHPLGRPEFARFSVGASPSTIPAADTIHLVMDNLSSHTRKALVDRFGEADGRMVVGSAYRALTRPSMEAG